MQPTTVRMTVAATLLALLAASGSVWRAGAVSLGTSAVTGSISTYHTGAVGQRSNTTGIAVLNGLFMLTDSGDAQQDYLGVRINATGGAAQGQRLDNRGSTVTGFRMGLQDIQDASVYPLTNRFIVTASMRTPSNPNTSIISQFNLNLVSGTTYAVANETVVDLRSQLLSALISKFGYSWYRASTTGGLNVEGLSQHHGDSGTIVLGLRSPLWTVGQSFATGPLQGSRAILAYVRNPFGGGGAGSGPQFAFRTLDLGGQGVRGLEWIPAMNRYVVISGGDASGGGYKYWSYDPYTNSVSQLTLPTGSNATLCHPRDVVQYTLGGQPTLLFVGEPCSGGESAWLRTDIVADPTLQVGLDTSQRAATSAGLTVAIRLNATNTTAPVTLGNEIHVRFPPAFTPPSSPTATVLSGLTKGAPSQVTVDAANNVVRLRWDSIQQVAATALLSFRIDGGTVLPSDCQAQTWSVATRTCQDARMVNGDATYRSCPATATDQLWSATFQENSVGGTAKGCEPCNACTRLYTNSNSEQVWRCQQRGRVYNVVSTQQPPCSFV